MERARIAFSHINSQGLKVVVGQVDRAVVAEGQDARVADSMGEGQDKQVPG